MDEPSLKRRASQVNDAPPTPSDPPSAVAPSIKKQQELSGRPSATTTNQSSFFRVSDQSRSASAGGCSHKAKAPKIAILCVKKNSEGSPADPAKPGGCRRVTHACEPCRQRKTKCSGERPVCKHCQDFKVSCYYAEGKRDSVKKQFGTMTKKLAEYEALLKDLSGRVSKEDAEIIRQSLEKEVFKSIESPSSKPNATESFVQDEEGEVSGGEGEVSGGAGSTGALDCIAEDFARNEKSRATGFIGRNSEVTWLQRLQQENRLGSPERFADEPEFKERSGGASALFDHHRSSGAGPSLSDIYKEYTVSESSYQLDDFSVLIPDPVDPYELPPKETAENLFNVYLSAVHPSFPLIGKETYTSQFRRFFNGSQVNPGPKWLAILNLIFAVSSRYSHLILAPRRGDERDHLIYFARARQLGVNDHKLFAHPDLQQIQIAGLSAFYLVATNQINRAWTIGGIAVRAAVGLGLNMRNESARTRNSSKEIRYRVWWSLYVLEQQICMMTGRPTSILDPVCTAPLPIPYDEDTFLSQPALRLLSSEMQRTARRPMSRSGSTSNANSTPTSDRSGSGSKPTQLSPTPSDTNSNDISSWAKGAPPSLSLYFLYYVELTRIGQDILNQLYTPESMTTTWANVQETISHLSDRLDGWLSGTPTVFDFTRKQQDQNFLQQRVALGFCFYGTRIILNRPCLCRLEREILRQSSKSIDFTRLSATTCINSARAMLDLIPDRPNAIALNELSLWWCILHFLVKATTVLMHELSFRANHIPEQAESILTASKKGVRWLHQLSEQNLAASRAWKLCDTLLRNVAPKVGGDIKDLPTQISQRQLPVSAAPGLHINPAMDLSFAPRSMYMSPAPQDQMDLPFDQFNFQQGLLSQADDYDPTAAEVDFLSDKFHSQDHPNFGMGSSDGPHST